MFVIGLSSHGTYAAGARKDGGTEIWFFEKKESVGGGGRTGAGQVILGAMTSSLPAPPPGTGGAGGAGAQGSAGGPGAGGTGAGAGGARTEDIRRTAARLFERRGYAATTIS